MCSLNKDTLELIQETAREAEGAKSAFVVHASLPDPTLYAVVDAFKGEALILPKPVKPVNDKLGSLFDLEVYLSHVLTDHNSTPMMTFTDDFVCVLHNQHSDEHDQGKGVYALSMTDEFGFLSALPEKCEEGIKSLTRHLKSVYSAAMTESSKQLLKCLEAIVFESGSKTDMDRSAGRESLGMSITSEVRSKHGDIPEIITLNIRVYRDEQLEVRFPVRFAVECDAVKKTVELVMDQESYDKLIYKTKAALRVELLKHAEAATNSYNASLAQGSVEGEPVEKGDAISIKVIEGVRLSDVGTLK